MNWLLYALAVRQLVTAVLSIATVGKPRKSFTGPDVAGMVLVDAAIVTILVLAAMRL